MIKAATAALKHRKPTNNDGRAEFVDDLLHDLERVKDALEALGEMTNDLLTSIEEVGEADSMAEMRDSALVEDVREKAQWLIDALTDGIDV